MILNRSHLLPGERVPHFGGEVGRPRRREGRRSVQAGAPHRALVSLKRPDPVARRAVAEHGLAVLAGAHDEQAVLGHGRELEVHDRPGVPVTNHGTAVLDLLEGLLLRRLLSIVDGLGGLRLLGGGGGGRAPLDLRFRRRLLVRHCSPCPACLRESWRRSFASFLRESLSRARSAIIHVFVI